VNGTQDGNAEAVIEVSWRPNAFEWMYSADSCVSSVFDPSLWRA